MICGWKWNAIDWKRYFSARKRKIPRAKNLQVFFPCETLFGVNYINLLIHLVALISLLFFFRPVFTSRNGTEFIFEFCCFSFYFDFSLVIHFGRITWTCVRVPQRRCIYNTKTKSTESASVPCQWRSLHWSNSSTRSTIEWIQNTWWETESIAHAYNQTDPYETQYARYKH